MRIADFAFEFLLGHQGGDRVDDDHIDRVAFDQHFGDLHRFFAVARLADEQRFELHAQLLGPTGVEGMLGVDERGDAARFLGLGDHVQGQRGLAARFGAKDLDDAAAGNALAAEGQVERQAAGGDALECGDPRSPPSGMIDPSPNCFSIAATVLRSSSLMTSPPAAAFFPAGLGADFLETFSFLAIRLLGAAAAIMEQALVIGKMGKVCN